MLCSSDHVQEQEAFCKGLRSQCSLMTSQQNAMHKSKGGVPRDAMMWLSCWGASSLSRLAYASCAAAASLKQLLVTQKLYRTCK